jgi:hypothetical protein
LTIKCTWRAWSLLDHKMHLTGMVACCALLCVLCCAEMKLSQLLREANIQFGTLEHDPEVTGVTLDSRAVKPGFVFVAVRGVPLPSRVPLDGHDYIAKAIGLGAVAVVGTREGVRLQIPYVNVPNDRRAVADLSSAFWGFPGRTLELIGITGLKLAEFRRLEFGLTVAKNLCPGISPRQKRQPCRNCSPNL